MFKNLTDFSFQRNKKQAAGFYLAWLLVGIILAALAVDVYLHVSGLVVLPKSKGFAAEFGAGLQTIGHMGHKIMPFAVFVYSAILALLVMRAKRKMTNSIAWVLFIFTAALSLKGAVFSLIPVACLTLLPKGEKNERR